MVTYVLACSVILQLTAAVMAFRLIRITGGRAAWSLIAVALVLMSARRAIPLYHLLSGNSALTPDLLNELVGLALSTLMVLGVAGIAPLFSAIKRSHEALRESEELYRTVFENTGTATVLIEESTIIAYANAEFERLSKCSKQEIEGKKSWTEFVVKEDLDRMRTQHLLRREKPEAAQKHYEFRFITNEGDIRNIFLSIDVIPGTKRSVASLLDITDRKRAEEALRESERKLREAQEMAHLGYWYFDVKTGQVDWSEEVYRIFGLEPKEFTPHIDSILALSPWPEDHQRDKEIIRLAIASHEPGSYEQKFLRPDKSIGHYYSTFQGNYDDQGELVSIVGTVLDITDRKLAEEALRASEEKFRGVFEYSTAGKSLTAPDGRLLRVNRALADMLSYTIDELQQVNFAEITHPDDVAESRECVRLLVANEREFYRMEKRYLSKDGTIVWADVSTRLFRDVTGNPQYLITSVINITDRKRAEEALHNLLSRQEAILDAVPDIIMEVDNNKIYTWANLAGFEFFGEDVLGKEAAFYFESAQETYTKVQPLFNGSEDVFYVESWQRRKDGQKRLLAWWCRVLKDGNGNVTGALSSAQDITNRKQAEQALIASEIRYRRLFESAKDGILILDAETGMIVDVNPFLVRMLGYSHEQFLGKAIWEVGFLSDTVASKYNFRKLQHEKYVRYDDLPLKTSDGRQIEVEFVSNVYNVDHTKVIQCNIRDVTGRKLAKEALIASEVRYRRLFESAKDGILILDAETGMVVDVNPFLIEMLGYSHKQFLGKTVWELAFLRDLVSSKDNFRTLQRERYVRFEDLPLQTSDGRRIEVEFVSNVYDVGETKVIQCNIRDITDRKRAEVAVRESEQKLRATVYGSPIPQFVIDRDHRVVYWNKALEEISGRKAEEMVGTGNYWSAFYKEKRPCMCDLLVDGLADSLPEWYGAQFRKSPLVADAFEVTDFFPHLGGGGKWLSFTAVPIKDSAGNVIGAMETLEDVTGRIKAEMVIHQLNEDLEKRVIDRTAQLQAANKELEAFSYSVSHDLRAPLRALDGFSRILIEDFAAQLPDEAVGHLNRVRNGASHMGRLIDDLLRFSRLGRQPLQKQSINLSALVEEIWSALESEREGRQVELVMGSLPGCEGDPSLLKQVFSNLLSNALKYSRHTADARIEIGCLPQVIRAGEPLATNVYFVRDNGVGFDMQFANKLFGVFQRLHRAEEYEGTGVGLAIVQRIIARHGGRVWAESEPDKGATFYLTIGDVQVSTEPIAEKVTVRSDGL